MAEQEHLRQPQATPGAVPQSSPAAKSMGDMIFGRVIPIALGLVVLVVLAILGRKWMAESKHKRLFEEAVTASRNGDLDLAIAKATEAIDNLPRAYAEDAAEAMRPVHLELRGKCYLQSKKYDAAIADLDEAVRLLREGHADAENSQRVCQLRDEAYRAKGLSPPATTDLPASPTSGQPGISPQPQGQLPATPGPTEPWQGQADAIFVEARRLYDVGENDAAITKASEAIALVPKDNQKWQGDLHGCRAMCYFAKSDYKSAITDFDEAIRCTPTVAEHYSFRGMAYCKTGQNDLALASIAKALEMKPNYAVGYLQRGLVKMETGDYDGAIADMSKAIELQPDFARAYERRGEIYAKKGDKTAAEWNFKRAKELSPKTDR